MAFQDDYKNFLLDLDQTKNKTIFARIIALTFSELPIEQIEGRITQGSINIDGASAVRRSCSLTMTAQNFDYSNYTWGLNTKFKLEIGVENSINSNYPDIIWFPQGIYVLTSFNISQNTNSFTISLQGKDKMCLLNGEVGGNFESSIDFGVIEEENQKGEWIIRKLSIPEIIRNMIHTYGGEPYHNIIINDLDTYGLELLEYRYDVPMYLYRKPESQIYTNILLENNNTILYYEDGSQKKLKDLDIEHLELLTETLGGNTDNIKPVYSHSSLQDKYKWYFTKIENGQTAGYRMTDLTYAGDLIAGIGESITSVLDKIKNMLVEFEYFYDLEGHFVFQKKQSFISTMWTPSEIDAKDGEYISENFALSTSLAYSFINNELITAFNNNPNLLNVRNDYSIWGERVSASGAKLPVHLRYAIDTKPQKYTQIIVSDQEVIPYNKQYNTLLTGRPESEIYTYIASNIYQTDDVNKIIYCDWREVLYQMALDYYKYNYLDDFELKVAKANRQHGLYLDGRTNYEQYYIDLQGFWRQLYYPNINETYEKAQTKVEQLNISVQNMELFLYGSTDNITGIRQQGLVDKISMLNSLINKDEKIAANQAAQGLAKSYNLIVNTIYDESTLNYANEVLSLLQNKYQTNISLLTVEKNDLLEATSQVKKLQEEIENFYPSGENIHWNKNVYEAPETLNFWFDFLDTNGALSEFSVKVIGSRPKAINDSTVKSIYFRETPDVIFQESGSNFENLSAYKSIQVPHIESMFSISAQGKNAKDRLDELLYQHGYCIENITITSIPIYYLQPNTRIYVYDKETNISGDYIVSKITLPLSYNGTMSITATKAAKDIL